MHASSIKALRGLVGNDVATTQTSLNPRELRARKHQANQRAEILLAKAKDRDFSPEEQDEFDNLTHTMRLCNADLEQYEAAFVASSAYTGRRPFNIGQTLPNIVTPPGTDGDESVMGQIAAFVRTGKMMAVDSPLNVITSPVSGGAAASIPVTVLNDVLRAYIGLNPFQAAGATFYETDGDISPLVKPIISSGSAFGVYAEGSSATDSAPPQIDAFTFGASKYSRLVKVSNESLLSVGFDLTGEILAELFASVASSFSAACTTAMVTALDGNSGVVVDQGSDIFESLLDLIHAVPTRYAANTNKFMLSRAALGHIKNVRDNNGRPILDQTSSQLLGYEYVNNDNLEERIVFGQWDSGVFIRRTNLELLRLIELYSEAGQVGFKMTQFLDQKFPAAVHTVTNQPLVILAGEVWGS